MAEVGVCLDGIAWAGAGNLPPTPGGGPGPDPGGGPSDPGDWLTAVQTRSYPIVQAWYAAATGHEALGIAYGDLTPGSLQSTHAGQVIEGVRGGPIRIAHNNVTVRGCRIEGYGLHGAYYNPTSGANITGTVIEYCTYDGSFADVRANFFAPSVTSSSSIVRFCNIRGWRSGHTGYNGARFDYNWVHDLSSPNETHRTGTLIGGSGCHYYRNYVTDGGSGGMNIYGDINPINNSSLIENIINGSSPNASPSYLINIKNGEHGAAATDVKIHGNYFGHQYQFGILKAGNIPWNLSGNTRIDNQLFATGEPYGNA